MCHIHNNIYRTRRSRASSVSPTSSVSSSPKSASPTFDEHVQYYPARKPYRSDSVSIKPFYFQQVHFRMASSFELSSDQPALYYQRARKLTGNLKSFKKVKQQNWNINYLHLHILISANSYQNLFGEPTERHRPLSKKVSKLTPPEPRSRKQKPLAG